MPHVCMLQLRRTCSCTRLLAIRCAGWQVEFAKLPQCCFEAAGRQLSVRVPLDDGTECQAVPISHVQLTHPKKHS